jgi:hypothetical protein
MAKMKSEGKCLYCQETKPKSSISRHLEKHLAGLEPEPGKTAWHIRAEAGYYFLQLLMDGEATLQRLDDFLRKIWLECCGHMSEFSIGGAWSGGKVGKNRKANDVFQAGMKLNYVYDFGSSTELDIKVVNQHPISVKDKILLLSRNEPLEIICSICKKKAATQICIVHRWETEDCMFCDDCVGQHEATCEDAADYALMPIVNSPRMGECGYEGGTIDLERDGVFGIGG